MIVVGLIAIVVVVVIVADSAATSLPLVAGLSGRVGAEILVAAAVVECVGQVSRLGVVHVEVVVEVVVVVVVVVVDVVGEGVRGRGRWEGGGEGREGCVTGCHLVNRSKCLGLLLMSRIKDFSECLSKVGLFLFFLYRKTCEFASLFFRAIMNKFIQVIFSNIITYLERAFKEEQNGVKRKLLKRNQMKCFY